MLDTHERLIEDAYAAHHAALVRHLTAMTRDASEAEDLAHEAFLRLAGAIRDGRGPEKPGAWLYQVGRNLVIGRHRHRLVADRHAAQLGLSEPVLAPDHAAIARETHDALEAALQRLSPDERRAVLLAANGYAGGEVARAIGRTASATRTLLCRARGKLRGALASEVLNPA
jgi:RNA polymerase sigma-70 factor (ECF subfamily)